MYYFGSELISGVNVGFEHMSYKQIGRKGKGWIVLLDLLILRVMIEWDEEGEQKERCLSAPFLLHR